MRWPATSRSHVPVTMGPAGLAFVQDFLNTSSLDGDLLGTKMAAQRWLDDAMRCWCRTVDSLDERIVLTEEDVQRLRGYRGSLSRALRQRGTEFARWEDDGDPLSVSVQATLTLSLRGLVELRPAGVGWKRIVSIVLLEVAQAQQSGSWRRLKLCRNQDCPSVFFDRSPNNSALWHNARTCGRKTVSS
ncbi:CGNR zinc finger domain-containing protein [Streptomyces sp. NPDC090080]|uniref:CGNR zinc finger domain-containing protein n=1 Tax=Streptomyces sp. NPDC090080 TaxID=3365939 RepID=UPI00382C0DA0